MNTFPTLYILLYTDRNKQLVQIYVITKKKHTETRVHVYT